MATINPIDSSKPIEVAKGGTGGVSFTAYSVICGGTTSTGPLQNVSGVGTSGQLLNSNAAALPTWATQTNTGTVNILIPSQLPANFVTGGTRWLSPFNSNGQSTNQTTTQFIVPTAGTIDQLRVVINTNASTSPATLTLNKNSVNTTLQVSIGAGATGTFTDTTHTVSVAAGDLVQWELSATTVGSISGGANTWLSCRFSVS